jgi:excisionase family DNA binding protein
MDLVTSTKAARLLGVSTSTLKRWADQGRLRFVLTAGGHRRFDRTELARFRTGIRDEVQDHEARLLELLLFEPNPSAIQPALLEARNFLGSWWRTADMLGMVIEEMGNRWERGECDVPTEHFATHVLEQTLAICGGMLPIPPATPYCLLANVEGDDHALGLSLLELSAREAGWATRWLGAPTSTAMLTTAIADLTPAVVAVSASSFSRDAPALAAHAAEISKACKQNGSLLAFGGKGAWPRRPKYGQRLISCGELVAVLRLAAGNSEPGPD